MRTKTRIFSTRRRAREDLHSLYDLPDLIEFWTAEASQEAFIEFTFVNQDRYATVWDDGEPGRFDIDAALNAFFHQHKQYPYDPSERLNWCLSLGLID